MKRLLSPLVILIGIICAVSAHTTDVSEAARRYRETSDYASLQVITDALVKGMSRQKVQALLGPPQYSPTDGQDYYYSDRKELLRISDIGRMVPVGLVVTYRKDGRPEWWSLEPIAE